MLTSSQVPKNYQTFLWKIWAPRGAPPRYAAISTEGDAQFLGTR
jgi:hypothetical protein